MSSDLIFEFEGASYEVAWFFVTFARALGPRTRVVVFALLTPVETVEELVFLASPHNTDKTLY